MQETGVQERAEENGPMTFHESTPDELAAYVEAHAKDNDADSVVKAADEFCWRKHWMMNLGDLKGGIVDKVMQEAKPRTVLELGTYCGYSAVRLARFLPEGGKYYTIDPYPTAASHKLVAKAGLSDKVIFLQGTGAQVIPKLKSEHGVTEPFDLVFIDHDKPAYLSDLRLIEQHGLLHKGSYVVADNVIIFHINDYLNHVRNSGLYSSSVNHEALLEYTADTTQKDGVEVSIWKGAD
jgi:catechol O-methyltransferase